MKKILLVLISSAFLFSAASQAGLVETKYRVVSRYVDVLGETHSLFNTRAYIRYNTEASARSPLAKSDCLITLGGKGIFQLASNASVESCVSDREYVIVSQDVILKMMNRAVDFALFNETAYMGYHRLEIDLKHGASRAAKLENLSVRDQGALVKLKSVLRNLFQSDDPTEVISTQERTVFVLSSEAEGRFTLELEPISVEILGH